MDPQTRTPEDEPIRVSMTIVTDEEHAGRHYINRTPIGGGGGIMHLPSVAGAVADSTEARDKVDALMGALQPWLRWERFLELESAINWLVCCREREAVARLLELVPAILTFNPGVIVAEGLTIAPAPVEAPRADAP